MFKKLRNRLLLVNMMIISLLLLASFGVIYVITWKNTERDTRGNLAQIMQMERRFFAPPAANHSGELPEHEIKPPDKQRDGRRNDMIAHFVVYTDENGAFREIHSPLTIEDETYKEKLADICAGGSDYGVMPYAGGYWAYMRIPTEDGYAIGFMDYTPERRILVSLALILGLVWLAAVAAAFLISLRNANRSIKPVEESYNRQKQFVADASHELKTPLTTINTNVDVLLSHKSSTIAEEERWLQYIKGEAERMTKLTNDLLYLARLDHTEDRPQEERASFSEAAESILLTMEAVIFEKNIEFEYEIEPDINVKSSFEKLSQLVMILLDNAVKYTAEGGRIAMTLAETHGEAVLKVRNTGSGISAEDRRQIFERFYRADKSRTRESGGYGLGLAIAKAICESAGGSISVESDERSFTEFVVKI